MANVGIPVETMRPDYRQDTQILVQRADKALYRAKNGGRNQVCADPLPPLRCLA